jgi:hypothetical protein
MRGIAPLVLPVVLVLVPAVSWAQTLVSGSIAGVVRDTSGAVLPGVTIEAASPALIEKVRTATTDGQGQYKIVDLRPGTYTVTFTLPGFSTVTREGLELTTGFTATVNAELRLGTVAESITPNGVFTNAQVAPSLGRNLAGCPAATGPCTATVTVPILEPFTMFEDRLTQLDVRLSRIFRFGGTRLQGMFDVYNVFNASSVLGVNTTYGSAWLVPTSVMAGRLFKFGAQLNF